MVIFFSATASLIVVSMTNVIRGFGLSRADTDEAMIPIAGQGK
jgi:hypothetical protein